MGGMESYCLMVNDHVPLESAGGFSGRAGLLLKILILMIHKMTSLFFLGYSITHSSAESKGGSRIFYKIFMNNPSKVLKFFKKCGIII